MTQLSIKYRPRTFAEVAGHQKVVQELLERSKNKSFPQAMYFSGLSGVGKSSLQYLIAKAITCENLNNGEPCNECKFCRDINEEEFSLSVYIYNCSNVSLDDMRDMESIASTTSLTSQYKIFIIDELQELSNQKKAQKAILKILEIEQKNNYYILGSMDDGKVDTAIKNRTVPYKLYGLDYETLGRYLGSVCEKEGIGIDTKKARVLLGLANNSNGSVRTALSYLERCISSNIWDDNEVIKELGIVNNDKLRDITGMILKGDVKVFQNEINDEVIKKIRYLLSLTYKKQLGLDLNRYQKDMVGGLGEACSIASVKNTIMNLNTLQQYIYTTNEVIDFLILKSIEENKDLQPEQQQKRRRRPIQ